MHEVEPVTWLIVIGAINILAAAVNMVNAVRTRRLARDYESMTADLKGMLDSLRLAREQASR